MNVTLLLKNTQPQRINALFDGDSLTFGYGATVSYPAALKQKYLNPKNFYTTNFGLPGQNSWGLLSDFQTHLNENYRFGFINIISIMVGINDIFNTHPSDEIMSNILTAVSLAKLKGFKVSINTLIPATYGSTDEQLNSAYSTILATNYLIRSNANTYGYTVVDLANDPKYNYRDAFNDITIYNADKIHQNNAGYQHIADLIYAHWMNIMFLAGL